MTRYVRGASIYKPASRSRRTDPFLIAYSEDGKRRTLTGSTDLRITIAKANEIGLRLEASKLGIADRHANRIARAELKPINDHVEVYRKTLIAKHRTEQYANDTAEMCKRVFAAAGIVRLPEITESGVQQAIAGLKPRRAPQGGENLSNRQLDKAVRAVKSFCHWLKKEHRAAVHVLADLGHYDPELDRRRIRRALSVDEVLTLIEAAEAGKVRCGLTGADRAMLYRLATGTGFRFSALLSLTVESFELDNDPPLVNVQGRKDKSRKNIEQPIRADLAALLKPWLKGRTGKLFTPKTGFIESFKKDLEAAGIKYRDSSGHYFDFHAQRNQFITAIVREAGLKVAQDLAHHSTPVLTAKYARMTYDDYGKGLAALPPVQRKKEEKKKLA